MQRSWRLFIDGNQDKINLQSSKRIDKGNVSYKYLAFQMEKIKTLETFSLLNQASWRMSLPHF